MPPPVLNLAKAKKSVVAEWRRWAKHRGSSTIIDMQVYYFSWLKKSRPGLLAFKSQGDQWQAVREWLQQEEDSQAKL